MDKTIPLFAKSKKVESSLVLLDCINRIWTILKEKTKVHDMTNSINYCLKVTQLYQMNMIGQSSIELTSKDLITNNFYKSISYIVECLNIKTIFKFMLYPNTLDNTTLVLLEMEYEDKDTFEVDDFYKDISIEYLEALSIFLRGNAAFLYEYQSILINCNLAKIWKYIVNNKHLGSVSPSGIKLCDEIDQTGDKFTYIIQNEVQYGKLNKCDRDNGKKWTFAFEVYDKEYTQMLCLISFFFLYINENMVFIAYNHDFNKPIDQISLNEISKRKKDFLNDIKKYMEK